MIEAPSVVYHWKMHFNVNINIYIVVLGPYKLPSNTDATIFHYLLLVLS